MIPICYFESNSNELMQIWNRGVSYFENLPEYSAQAYCSDPLDLPDMMTIQLLFTGDIDTAYKQLDDTAKYLLKDTISGHANCISLFGFLLMLEEYLIYTGDIRRVKEHVGDLNEWLVRYVPLNLTDITLSLGCRFILQRILATCNLPFERAQLAGEVRDYYQTFHDEILRSDDRLLLYTIIASCGFTEDNEVESIKKFLLEHSFELPRKWQGVLYRALANLELNSAFFPTMLEGGGTRAGGVDAPFADVVALVKYLCGVDIAMLGQGIYCASPRLPEYVSYQLSLPSGFGYILYEGGDFNAEIYP